jgi:NADPH-dependent 2,4-dienoyl-CoA reductase/sulfur reductase-like enzyme
MMHMATIAAAEALQDFQRILPETPGPGNATEAYKTQNELAYAISQVPLGTPRSVKVVVVGAGFSGLAFAREVEIGNLKNATVTVYEKNASVGGTWYENRYPGYVDCAMIPREVNA